MEILELLVALLEFPGCFLEIAAVGADVLAGVFGYRWHKSYRTPPDTPAERQRATRRGWSFAVLVFVAVFLTSLSVWKFLR